MSPIQYLRHLVSLLTCCQSTHQLRCKNAGLCSHDQIVQSATLADVIALSHVIFLLLRALWRDQSLLCFWKLYGSSCRPACVLIHQSVCQPWPFFFGHFLPGLRSSPQGSATCVKSHKAGSCLLSFLGP